MSKASELMAIVAVAAGRGWAQECASWTNLNLSGCPSGVGLALVVPAMAYNASSQQPLLFGSSVGSGSALGYLFNGSTWQLAVPTLGCQGTDSPGPRYGAAMVFDPRQFRQCLVMCGGGLGTQGALVFERVSTWMARGSAPGVLPRAYHGMVFDTARSRTLLFGGAQSSGAVLGDTWEYDGLSTLIWVQRTAPGPAARSSPAMVYDIARDRTIVFGGFGGPNQTQPLGDTWSWDGNTWTQLFPAASPAARGGATMVYDPDRAVAVLYGGLGVASAFGDTWEWNGADWMQRMISGPSPRMWMAACYDAPRRQVLAFGGGTAIDTWAYRVVRSPAITQQPLAVVTAAGGSAGFRVVATGDPQLTYQWRRNGVSLTDGGAVFGSNSPALVIAPVVAADAGSYDVVVSNSCSAATSTAVLLSVTCYANCDNSSVPPVLNVLDFNCFLNRFAAGCP